MCKGTLLIRNEVTFQWTKNYCHANRKKVSQSEKICWSNNVFLAVI